MRGQSNFTKDRSVYWPGEFADVVNTLTGKSTQGVSVGNPIYQFNTGAIVFAASVGLKHKRKREVGSDRKEITTGTFFRDNGLEKYIFLIVMLGTESAAVDMLRVEQEEAVIREFERYAAGGLEYLRAEFELNPTQSPDVILEKMFRENLNIESSEQDLPDL
jgi:dnd system-associated protein 4